ncbi:hypothetical protein RFI_12642 [Reticulomyxa filosa]|uniref:PATROL1-like C-terminal domain-containing protein n=1 Tax=Reticulomyxa filosa TaxID=46433 RepID=X6NFJ5_RETFI|nr:hypothetical protein RFI_12642 [Reticulomyxa filosa]|eukprot:ETO24514.1 hypothetical protein RFI_12642 [Reticulomyxa filosa]
MKLKDLYDIALILDGLSVQSSMHDNSSFGQLPDVSKGRHSNTNSKADMLPMKSTESNSSNHPQSDTAKVGTEEIKEKERGLIEYFREEKNRRQWWEYIEEIEMLFRDDAEISKALWQDGGMETLALHFVTDITSILTLNSESLDTSYRVLLAGSYRLQVLLQSLCSTYKRLEFEKAKEIKKQLVRGFNDEDLELEAMPVGAISRRGSLNEIFGESAAAEELRTIGESAAHQKVDQIFSFVHKKKQEQLLKSQHGSSSSSGGGGDYGDDHDDHHNHTYSAKQRRDSATLQLSGDEDNDDNKITWAHFVTDSFLFIDNEISAYFANIKGFPAEAMTTAVQFYQQLYFLIDYILRIINSSFADIATLENNSREGNKINQKSTEQSSKMSSADANESKKNEQQHQQRSFSSKMIRNLGKGVAEIADANRRAFGIVYSTFDIVNHVKAVKDVAASSSGNDTVDMNDMYITINFLYYFFSLSLLPLSFLHLLTDSQFKQELIYLCVKYSSISRIQEVVSDLGPRLLRYIDELEEPKEGHLKEKFKSHRDELINSAHKFITECKELIATGLHRGAKHIARQCLDVQNQHFFSFELYAPQRIQSTTVQKLGLLDKLNEYLIIGEENLRSKDMRSLSTCLASVYSRRMCHALIGPTKRIFGSGDTEVIEQDFTIILELFSEFNPIDFDEKRCPLENETHPLFSYFSVVKLMKTSTSELIRQHVLAMTARVEQEEEKDKDKERREAEAIEKKLKDEKYLKKQDQQKLQSKAHAYHKMLRDRHRIKKSHDHPTLHVLAHRNDEEALTYVENFVQFADTKKQPLVSNFLFFLERGRLFEIFLKFLVIFFFFFFDLGDQLVDFCNMRGILRVIVHSARDIPAMNTGNTSDPCKLFVVTVVCVCLICVK